MSGNTYQITPFMRVADLDATLRFLTERLGFTVAFRHANYAYAEREGAAIRTLEHGCPTESVSRTAASSTFATSARCLPS